MDILCSRGAYHRVLRQQQSLYALYFFDTAFTTHNFNLDNFFLVFMFFVGKTRVVSESLTKKFFKETLQE